MQDYALNCSYCGTKRVSFSYDEKLCCSGKNRWGSWKEFALAICKICQKPAVLSGSAPQGQFKPNGGFFISYANKNDNEHIDHDLWVEYEESCQIMNISSNNAGMGFRRILDIMTKKLLDEDSDKKKSLYERLKLLEKKGKIQHDLLDWAHNIRTIGNAANHDEERIEKETAEDLKHLVEMLFEYIYVLPGKLKKYQSDSERGPEE